MAKTNPDWEKIYADFKSSGLSKGNFIRKYQLSSYAFEKFKRMDAISSKKELKSKEEAIFAPVKIAKQIEESTTISKEDDSIVLYSGNIQIVVTERTSQKVLINVLKALHHQLIFTKTHII